MRSFFAKHPALWRAIAGLAIGFVLEFTVVYAVDYLAIERIVLFLALPFASMHFFLREWLPESLLFVLSACLYPTIFAVVGFLTAQRNRTVIVTVGAIVAAAYVGLAAWGWHIFIVTFV